MQSLITFVTSASYFAVSIRVFLTCFDDECNTRINITNDITQKECLIDENDNTDIEDELLEALKNGGDVGMADYIKNSIHH